jgi:hypothetical protein
VERPLGARESPAELEKRILDLLEGRRGFDVAFGAVALQLREICQWRELGYECEEHYCRERLGMSARTFRQRVWLERQMRALPELREALASGRLSYTKALSLANDTTPETIDQRIAEAAATTCQQTEQETTEAERRQNRARGVLRLWGPEDAMQTCALAIASAKALAEASGLGLIKSGTALALIARHFLEVWEAHKSRQPDRRRREVLERTGGLCAVPGCSRPAQESHHMKYRSQGGSDDPSNLVGLCAMHHRLGVHSGHLEVSGTAGEHVEWKFGNGERWITRADNSVFIDLGDDVWPRPGREVYPRRDRSA